MKKIIIDKEILYQLYVVEQKSLIEISEIVILGQTEKRFDFGNCSSVTFYKSLMELRIFQQVKHILLLRKKQMIKYVYAFCK